MPVPAGSASPLASLVPETLGKELSPELGISSDYELSTLVLWVQGSWRGRSTTRFNLLCTKA